MNEKRNISKAWCLDVQGLIVSPPDSQDELASKAATDLESLYGTKYTYGSTFNTICKFHVPHSPDHPHHLVQETRLKSFEQKSQVTNY